ncbi:GlxA family transcriptional regulator [Burkholderia cepacia]|uniref:GlxA family transcriptional regulator n=1 Tax=Burkholderia cepacia TaxID=292 RepID=UPI002AB7463D|nr:helix-turn-helix domain-containing protein [Burkholderia cepacia]
MHKVGYLVCDGFQVMHLTTQSVFEHANAASHEPFYSIETFSAAGGAVRSSFGASVKTRALRSAAGIDTWIVTGPINPLGPSLPVDVIELLRVEQSRAKRIAGICTGSFALAEAGLLDGKSATTHWLYARQLQNRFPKARVCGDRIFVNDGSIWTSGGMTAGFDLTVAIVKMDLGAEVADSVARRLLVHPRRAGGQLQHSESTPTSQLSTKVQRSLDYARANLGKVLTVSELAGLAELSDRQFSRVFKSETGLSPAKAVEQMRLAAARTMMESGNCPLDVIAKKNGFRDGRHMREVFLRNYGVPPTTIRRDVH